MTKNKGVLLVNLGSPDSPSVPDVRAYLREFLSDPRVLDIPTIKRQTILNLFILPFRPKESAHAYEQVWTENGSPLIHTTMQLRDLLRERSSLPIEVGMRYGNPSTESAVRALVAQGVDQIFVVPLYPHYAMSSYETAVAKVQTAIAAVAPGVELRVQPPFYNDPDYIEALVEASAEHLAMDWDHILFTYHGIPERHLRKADSSGCFCLKLDSCCDNPNPAHGYCYRAQVLATTRAFVAKAGIAADKYSLTFQSRLGRDPWLKPYTDVELERFPAKNIKKLLVISPAFVADCLETIEELGMRGKESFIQAGGTDYHLIPCLNTHPRWVQTVEKFIQRFEATSDQPQGFPNA
ncbi:MAG: ferrochelatase [Bradymonadaceae bacterium]|nr:ferrochelatase [Lujinxingiaceae bacterium]